MTRRATFTRLEHSTVAVGRVIVPEAALAAGSLTDRVLAQRQQLRATLAPSGCEPMGRRPMAAPKDAVCKAEREVRKESATEPGR